jgi:phospholipid-binding lipoprotein MlaA
MKHQPSTRSVAALAAVLIGTVSATQASAQAMGPINDPWEGMNRNLYSVHKAIDRAVLRPLMLVYVQIPRPARSGLANVAGNLGEPITFVNDVLQVRPRAAGRTLTRFATNSTLGVGGVFNLAERAGFPRHYSDFGQTLGRYGVGPGPFLIVPGLGPSTVRDIFGRVVDTSIDPVNRFEYDHRNVVRIARPAVVALEARAFFDTEIQQLDQNAIDPYATLRAAYLQNRQSLIRGGQGSIEALPDFEPDAAASPSASGQEPPAAQ